MTIIAIVILAFDAIFGFWIQIRMKQVVAQMKADTRKKQIELDEELRTPNAGSGLFLCPGTGICPEMPVFLMDCAGWLW